MLNCFKAYDIRGRLGDELNEDIARRIGRAFAEVLGARRVVLGRDCRASSAALVGGGGRGAGRGRGRGAGPRPVRAPRRCISPRPISAPMAGSAVTASHNPMDYNGMKMVQRGLGAAGRRDRAWPAIKALAEAAVFAEPATRGRVTAAEGARAAYVERRAVVSSMSRRCGR